MPESLVKPISTKTQMEGSATPDSGFREAWQGVLPFAIVFAVTCTLFFAHLGNFPLFNPDEALYAEPAKEMLAIGDYITTYLNYVVRFTKPPITIWGQALGIVVFGCNEFAVRFFGATAGALLVAATYCFAEKFAGRRAAIASSMVLCTAPLFVGTARMAITDMPLSLFTASGMMCFYAAFKKTNKNYLWLAYVLTGLAVMTKGPVGIVLPVAILGLFHLLRNNWKEALRFYSPVIGALIVGLIALPWFTVEIYITKGAYFNDFILRENFQRFTSVVDSHKGGWWYHIAAMLAGFFPWSVFIPQALFGALQVERVRALWRNGPLKVISTYCGEMSLNQELALYCLCWTVITVGFFSASVSKLLPYTLPAFPAVALLIALEFDKILETRNKTKALVPAILLASIFAGISLVLPHLVSKLRDAPTSLIQLAQSLCSYELIFTMVAVAFTLRRSYRTAFFAFLGPTVLSFLYFGGQILTELSNTWEQPLPDMARFAGSSSLPVLVFDMRKPSMPFYTGRQVIQPSSQDAVKEFLASDKAVNGAYVLTKTKQKEFFENLPGCKVVCSQGKFLLVKCNAIGVLIK